MASVGVYAYNRAMAQNYYVTPTSQASRFSKKTLLIASGLVAAIIVAILLLGSSGGNSTAKQLQHLSLRITSLQALIENSDITKNIKHQGLSQINTELKLTLTSNTNELTPLMLSAGMPPKFDKSIIASETDTSSATKLEEAALNNKFDQAYAETLGQKIVSLRALIAETYRLTKNTELRQALVALDNTLLNSKKNIDKLNL